MNGRRDDRIGFLDEDGRPIPKYSPSDCMPIIGDSPSKTVEWKTGSDVSGFETKPTRLRVEMSDAQLFGFQFTSDESESQSQRNQSNG